MSDEIQYPAGFTKDDIVAWGNTGLIVLDRSSNTVIKNPHGPDRYSDVEIEKKIYERLSEGGGHNGILRYYGDYDSGIRLEYACNQSIWSFLEQKGEDITIDQRLRWAEEVAGALAFVHSKGIIHGDIQWGNILLDEQLHAKVSDFGGSSLDGSPLLIAVRDSHMYPGPEPIESVYADIFALGSTIYEILTGFSPYHDLGHREIEQRYSKGTFPDTGSLGPIGNVIRKCWSQQYCGCTAVVDDIKIINRPKLPPNTIPSTVTTQVLVVTAVVVSVLALSLKAGLVRRWNSA